MSTIQNYVSAGFVLCGIMSISQSFACMPHSPDDVFIARFQSSQEMKRDNANFEIKLSSDQFILRSFMDRWRYSNPKQWHSAFSSEHVAKDSLIIGLAYTPDGGKPEQYQIASFAELSCKNDQLSISKPIAPFLAWNRQTANCALGDRKDIGILDGFLEHDQAYYLGQLQQKYPTCQKLNAKFPPLEMNDHPQHSQAMSGWERLINWFKSWF
ncbi:hypothetical protein [Acinetobacter sp. CFCC 10889]|uniref:hypothetical protein n=1 Tax=Acinetobacter sp. CFCC 10889 TaxID=1775557 RepID=UPI002AF6BA69|nr:hypothetical protein [Acinetobacter sp. CFCC 10889]